MALYKCTIPGRPGIKKNSKQIVRNRATNNLMIMPSGRYKNWAKQAAAYIRGAWFGDLPIDYEVNMCAIFYYKNRVRPDLSNAYQGIEDLLQTCGIVKNDRLITSHDGSHFEIDPNERVEITLTKSAYTSDGST